MRHKRRLEYYHWDESYVYIIYILWNRPWYAQLCMKCVYDKHFMLEYKYRLTAAYLLKSATLSHGRVKTIWEYPAQCCVCVCVCDTAHGKCYRILSQYYVCLCAISFSLSFNRIPSPCLTFHNIPFVGACMPRVHIISIKKSEHVPSTRLRAPCTAVTTHLLSLIFEYH